MYNTLKPINTIRVGLLIVIVSLLAACEISGTITVKPLEDSITNASYSTDFESTVEGETRFVICNDRTTELTYKFTFRDTFTSWTSYLQGVESGDIRGEVDLTTSDSRVQLNGNQVTVTYQINAGGAPTLTEPELDTQGIVVTPDTIRYTRLYIKAPGFTNAAKISRPIPVLTNCQNSSQPVAVSNARYETSHQATFNGTTRDVICDNKTTELRYQFDYTGDMSTWTSFLKGATTGTIRGQTTFNASQIAAPGKVDVTYSIQANGAPLVTDGGISSQAITVTPVPNPTVIGNTQLFVKVNGAGDDISLSGGNIPVVSNCP